MAAISMEVESSSSSPKGYRVDRGNGNGTGNIWEEVRLRARADASTAVSTAIGPETARPETGKTSATDAVTEATSRGSAKTAQRSSSVGVVFRDRRVGLVLALALLVVVDEATAEATAGTEATAGQDLR